MEFVPGQTLAERIGRLAVDEALVIARQIAEALEAAHDKGIVHRDLKPANVKITPDGQVKVLDFGLAKVGEVWSGQNLSTSPTMTAPATNAGVILGTASYMAPEQAKGRTVDRRADIFAFGCVLYEMLAGHRAFDGENVPDVLSRVLQRDPDWSRLPSRVPPSIRQLLRLCLEKDPRKRRQDAGDIRIDIEQVLAKPAVSPVSEPQRSFRLARLAWVLGVMGLIAGFGISMTMRWGEPPPDEMRLQIVTPPTLDPLQFALSPDSRYLVYVGPGSTSDAPQRLYLRGLGQIDPKPIAGTDGARLPFWSPDSRSVGFFAAGNLLRVDISGGPPQVLAPARNAVGGAWGPDGTILFAPNTVSPLLRIPESGGAAVAATQLDPLQNGHIRPAFRPDGRYYLFSATGDPKVSGIYLGSLGGGTPKRLTPLNGSSEFLPPDRVAFVQERALVSRVLDLERGELTGDPMTLVPPADEGELVSFSISAGGTVAHRRGNVAPGRLTRFDRNGKVLEKGGDLNAPDLSPDGRRLAFDRTIGGNRDVWILDLVRGGLTPFTSHTSTDGFPVWSTDGSRIAFHSLRNGTFDVWIKPSNGVTGEQLLCDNARQ